MKYNKINWEHTYAFFDEHGKKKEKVSEILKDRSMREILEMYVYPANRFLPGGKCFGKNVKRRHKAQYSGCLRGLDHNIYQLSVLKDKIILQYRKNIHKWVKI